MAPRSARLMRGSIALVVVAALGGAASAGPGAVRPPVTVPMAKDTYHAQTAKVLYLNRCVGGCQITKAGLNDARSHFSQIPNGEIGQIFNLTEFAWGDDAWNAFMTCMREVYSPYDVQITDVQPAGGVGYNEGIVAGSDHELNISAGGIAPITGDCLPYTYVSSFSFANDYGPDATYQLCWVAAQETAHAFGLEDHVYAFLDGTSACRDPLTYRADCGGQKFFRNEIATCGEFQPRPCRCGSPNSHIKLLAVLGAGTPITPPPVVALTSPAAGVDVKVGDSVLATARSQRGIKTMELWLNGYKWNEAKGVGFGPAGQPEAGYALPIPPGVPDGIIDIVVKAKDDIGATTATPVITVQKGAPCTSADTCAKGQRCDAGRCLWDPPVGELGEACTFPQYCLSGICDGTATEQICTEPCIPGVADSCPADYTCIAKTPANGVCWPGSPEETGCCSSSNQAAAQGALLGLAVLVVVRRRRRRVAVR